MKIRNDHSVRSATFMVLGISVAALYAPQAAAQAPKTPQDVHVVNAPTDPVPVKIDPANNTVKIDFGNNTVKIDGANNTVKATQTGPWNVGIAGVPSVTFSGAPAVSLAAGTAVQIGNLASNPALVRSVDRPAAQPYRALVSADFSNGVTTATTVLTAGVPAGKRLVIEFVTTYVHLPTSQIAIVAGLGSTGSLDHYITLTGVGNDANGRSIFVGTHRVFVIFEPDTRVTVSALRNSSTGTGQVAMTISGYLVDI